MSPRNEWNRYVPGVCKGAGTSENGSRAGEDAVLHAVNGPEKRHPGYRGHDAQILVKPCVFFQKAEDTIEPVVAEKFTENGDGGFRIAMKVVQQQHVVYTEPIGGHNLIRWILAA
ncbi:MAG: hypothetical protein EA363_02155 [Balneolaceae bacterium]|nr:MAG: hypothetical protein EA363_02155 [Balneolaceae bacterium]